MLFNLGARVIERGEGVFIAPGAKVIGSVKLESFSSVWFNAVIRGDVESIVIGAQSNIQDGAVLHADPGYPLIIDERVTVGHQAVVHGARIGECSLVGIHATVLNGAIIGRYCLIGANALVTERMVIPDGSLVLGAPARIVKPVTEQQKKMLEASASVYLQKAKIFTRELQPYEVG